MTCASGAVPVCAFLALGVDHATRTFGMTREYNSHAHALRGHDVKHALFRSMVATVSWTQKLALLRKHGAAGLLLWVAPADPRRSINITLETNAPMEAAHFWLQRFPNDGAPSPKIIGTLSFFFSMSAPVHIRA